MAVIQRRMAALEWLRAETGRAAEEDRCASLSSDDAELLPQIIREARAQCFLIRIGKAMSSRPIDLAPDIDVSMESVAMVACDAPAPWLTDGTPPSWLAASETRGGALDCEKMAKWTARWSRRRQLPATVAPTN